MTYIAEFFEIAKKRDCQGAPFSLGFSNKLRADVQKEIRKSEERPDSQDVFIRHIAWQLPVTDLCGDRQYSL